MDAIEFILYVSDQEKSRNFYSALLKKLPSLDVEGMTEFSLNSGCTLGLMPETGIAKILEDKVPEPATGSGIPRCELYLFCDDPAKMLEEAAELEARVVSPALERDWGHTVAYCADPDGHIIAFAKKTTCA